MSRRAMNFAAVFLFLLGEGAAFLIAYGFGALAQHDASLNSICTLWSILGILVFFAVIQARSSWEE